MYEKSMHYITCKTINWIALLYYLCSLNYVVKKLILNKSLLYYYRAKPARTCTKLEPFQLQLEELWKRGMTAYGTPEQKALVAEAVSSTGLRDKIIHVNAII